MVKCPCGKKIIFKRFEEREEDDEDSRCGGYAGIGLRGKYGSKPQFERRTRKVRIYGCEDPFCRYSSDMTREEFLELEENENDDFILFP